MSVATAKRKLQLAHREARLAADRQLESVRMPNWWTPPKVDEKCELVFDFETVCTVKVTAVDLVQFITDIKWHEQADLRDDEIVGRWMLDNGYSFDEAYEMRHTIEVWRITLEYETTGFADSGPFSLVRSHHHNHTDNTLTMGCSACITARNIAAAMSAPCDCDLGDCWCDEFGIV